MYRTWLIPYLEGALDAAQRAELEERLADDPALAAEMYRLRRALPRLRTRLAQRESPEAVPLWPRLRERLTRTRRRQIRPMFLRWVAGLFVITALLGLTAQDRYSRAIRTGRAEAKWRRELRRAPRVVFYRDNAGGTRTARLLRRRALRVAQFRRVAAFPPHAAAFARNPRIAADGLTF